MSPECECHRLVVALRHLLHLFNVLLLRDALDVVDRHIDLLLRLAVVLQHRVR